MEGYIPKVADRGFQHWVKASLAIDITKDGIKDAVMNSINTFHKDVLNDILTPDQIRNNDFCTLCTTRSIMPCPTEGLCIVKSGGCEFHSSQQKYFIPCPKGICDRLRDKIRRCHIFYCPSWKYTSTERWCQNPWEVGKCYLPPDGYFGAASIEEIDFIGILSLVMNHIEFKRGIDTMSYGEVREIVRKVKYSPNLCIDEEELNRYLDVLLAFLSRSDRFQMDAKTRESMEKLRKLRTGDTKDTAFQYSSELKEYHIKSASAKSCTVQLALKMKMKDGDIDDKDSITSSPEKRKLDINIPRLKQTSSTLSEKPYQQLVYEDDVNISWENVNTVSDALTLIQNESLPNQKTTEDMVKRLGRNSDVVESVCDAICQQIAGKSPDIVHVYAAYNRENENSLHFVVLFENEISSELQLEYNCCCRSCNNAEQTRDTSIEAQSDGVLSADESVPLRKTINERSRYYMEMHKYLSAFSGRKATSDSESEQCIVMYVHPCTQKYTSIPLKEDPLPENIGVYKVIVRNGVFKACGDGAEDLHNNIRMGCKITSNFSTGSGTLGGFIDHPVYGLCGFTCAHVVFNANQLKELKKSKRKKRLPSEVPCIIYQPDTSSEPIGRVVEATYTEGGDSDTAGVDLALFQIEKRHPVSGLFPSCRSNEKLNYDTGRIWGRTRITESYCNVQKFGMVTGCTQGKIAFDGMAVRELHFTTKDIIPNVDVILFNQYEIVNETEDVCQRGDSGGLVFMKDHEGELVCVGMVNGVLDKHIPDAKLHGVVTPVVDVLKELNRDNLKPFKNEMKDLEKRLSERIENAHQESNTILCSNMQSMMSNLYQMIELKLSKTTANTPNGDFNRK